MFELGQFVLGFALVVLVLGVLELILLPYLFGDTETTVYSQVPRDLLSSSPQGFIFGQRAFRYVRKKEEQDGHILVIGGAGSGKSSCLAVPSLLSWRERVFAVDIKGELYRYTRCKRHNVKALDPLSADAYGYDPYYLLRNSRNLVQDSREIALAIISKSPDVKEPFWVQGAQNLLTGAILYFFTHGFSFIDTILILQGTPVKQLVKKIGDENGGQAKFFISQFVDMDIKTLSGIYAELSNHIMVFATDPDIQNCLSREKIITVMDIENGFDIFLLIPEDKLDQWKGLLSLVVNQFMKHFERRDERGAMPVLFLLDEFPRLGKVEAVNGLATLRSKKIIICIIAQSLAQLDVIYGRGNRQVIADNCGYKAILRATDAETQEYFSRLVGTMERVKKSKSWHYGRDEALPESTSFSETSEEKRMIKPEKFATLKDIVLLTPDGCAVIKKAPYYKVTLLERGQRALIKVGQNIRQQLEYLMV
jgi:type IV secretion system protein VirD4